MRPAWMCLPPAILSAFIGALVTPTGAHAKSIKSYGWDEFVTLKLTDGRMIAGRWRGAFGSPNNPTDYAVSYETWRGAAGSYSAPALGESLIVTRTSGEAVVGAFQGFANRALLLGTADSCAHLVVMLDQVDSVRRAADPATDPEWTAARARWTSAPALDAIALQNGTVTLAVPATMVSNDWAKPGNGGSKVGLVILGVAAVGLISYVVAMATIGSIFNSASRGLSGAGR